MGLQVLAQRCPVTRAVSIRDGSPRPHGVKTFLLLQEATHRNALVQRVLPTVTIFQLRIEPRLLNVLGRATRSHLGTTTVPTWCYTIPVASRSYTPDCVNAGVRVAEWCYSIPVADRALNPSCIGAGTATVPPQVQELVCSIVPPFIRPLVGSILGCQ